jgi:hypothetical protein
MVHWEFLGLAHLQELDAASIRHGTEILSRLTAKKNQGISFETQNDLRLTKRHNTSLRTNTIHRAVGPLARTYRHRFSSSPPPDPAKHCRL